MAPKNKFEEAVQPIWGFVRRTLKYFRINDENNYLSLTNLAMLLILYKIAITPVTTFSDITALAIAVLGYQGKRLIEGFRK